MIRTYLYFFFFNDTATTEIYTLSLHDALPIYRQSRLRPECEPGETRRTSDDEHDRHEDRGDPVGQPLNGDRKSTRLNSSHSQISYAVFCLKKKKQTAVSRLQQHDRYPHSYIRT